VGLEVAITRTVSDSGMGEPAMCGPNPVQAVEHLGQRARNGFLLEALRLLMHAREIGAIDR
jgi:hypothetical protein